MMKDFRLPAETEIAFANLIVSDMGRALDFYQNKLGFQLVQRQNGTASLSSSRFQPVSIVLTEVQEAGPKPPRTTGLYHLAIRYPSRVELGQALVRLVQHSWRFAGAADHGVSEAIYTMDPDENGIELYADKPRSRWPKRNGQFAMVSEPLDLNELLNSVGGSGLDSTSAGPRMEVGHIHLQVSNLDRSRAFYQDILGLEVTQSGLPGALFLAAGKYHHRVGLNIWAGEGAPQPPANAVGLKSFGLRVPDRTCRALLVERLRSAGVPIQEKQDVVSGQKSTLFFDPDGNAIELVL